MKTALWMFGVICGIVFKVAYDYSPDQGHKEGVIIVAFFVVLTIAVVDAVERMPDKKDEKEIK